LKYIVIYFVQSMLLLVVSPLFIGIMKKMKAAMRGFQGPSIIQPYHDLIKLIKKGTVISSKSSFITTIGPIFILSASITVAFFIPVFYTNIKSNFGNLFIVIFALGVVKIFNALIGLDSGSTFSGMGSSREVFISMLVEPVIFCVIAFLYIETKDFNVFHITWVNSKLIHYSAAHFIAFLSFFIAILAENARMPFDNPETHLELTMMHEAMILDLSGIDLAFVELAAHIKFIIYLTILVNCFIPIGIATTFTFSDLMIGFIVFIFKILCCLFVISIFETTIAKSKLFRAAELLAASLSMAAVAITLIYIL
jgi:formate hydrogenlyase subunit 4